MAEESDAADYTGQVGGEENPERGEVASGSGGPNTAPVEEAPHPEGRLRLRGVTSAEKEKSLTEERYAGTKGQPEHREACQSSGYVQFLRTRQMPLPSTREA